MILFILHYSLVLVTASTYEHLVEDFREAEEARECRYAVFDAEYELKDGQKREKLVFFLW